jgi:hypothetical protein
MMIGSPLVDMCFTSALDCWFGRARNKSSLLVDYKSIIYGAIHAGKNAVWIHQLLGELGFPIQT